MHSTPSGGKPQARKYLKPRKPPARDIRVNFSDTAATAGGHDDAGRFPPIQPTDLPADTVLARLHALRLRVNGCGPNWQACCPAHPDLNPSLSLTETADGVLLVHCFADCDTEDVLAKLGLTPRHLYPSLYAIQFSKRRPQGTVNFHGGDGNEGDPVVEPTDEDCARWRRFLKDRPIPDYALNQLSVQLRLPREALLALKVGYDDEDSYEPCWLFPERDDRRRIVGIVRRYYGGAKRAVSDSRRGLTIPRYGKRPPPGPIYLGEGASDTAALVSVGAFVVGRSTARETPAERLWLTRLLERHPDREIVVVGDRDPCSAGARGAERLANFLHEALDRPVSWALPRKQFKDIREQVVEEKWHKGLSTQEELR